MRVLHLAGSPTSEFHADLSRVYAADCLAATADPARYEFLIAYVTPDGRWRFPADPSREAIAAAASMGLAAALAHLDALAPDVAVPQMFCAAGMTDYRALLDTIGLPYLGNPPEAMALTLHKARARAVVAAAGVAVPEGELLRDGEAPTLAPPVVVKPAAADNSVGVRLVRAAGELPGALAGARAHASEVLVERFVPLGREVRCGLLERSGELLVLPLEEYAVDPETKPIRDTADKLARDEHGDLQLMAKDGVRAWILGTDDPLTATVGAVARQCHRALGCRHYSLFDFRIDPEGRPWFLEGSLYCSFAQRSVVNVMAAAAGIDAAELFASVLREAL